MMINEDEEVTEKVSEDAVGEVFEEETEEDELDPELKGATDEFGAGLEEDTKSRDWE